MGNKSHSSACLGRIALWLVLSAVLLPVAASARTDKFAIVLGNNLGQDPAKKLHYAEQDAEKLHRVLLELGGFSPDDARLLLGANAEAVWQAIRKMEKRMTERTVSTGAKTLLLLFYSGHADGDILELGPTFLRYSDLLSFLKSSTADVRVAFLDSCQSGNLIARKGGHRGPGFDIRLTDEISSNGYAIVTSSAYDELSQESMEIRGAFFTHYLVSALRGAGDTSGDGKVTLNEAYQYAYSRTLARTSATIGGSQHPMYEFALEGRGDIVLTYTDRAAVQVTANLPETGRLVLVDDVADSIVTEVEVKAGTDARFAIPPGAYRAYLLAKNNAVRVAEIDAQTPGRISVSTDDFQTAKLETAVFKGGLFTDKRRELHHRLGVGGVLRRFPLEVANLTYGASLHYRLELPSGFEPMIKVIWTARPDAGVSSGYNDVGVMVGPGYLFYREKILLRVDVLVGYEQLIQDKREDHLRSTAGFDYLCSLGAELPLRSFFIAFDAGVGGRVFKIAEKGVVHRMDAELVLSLGWRWID